MTEIIQIDTHTWIFEDGFVRFFLLEGVDKAAMIDSGVNSADALAIAKTITDKQIILLNTHGDGDHTSGTGAFSEIHMHSVDYINCGMAVKYPETTLVELNDGDVVELGNRPIKVVYIPGHTKGSLAFLDVNSKTLYAGDSVQKGHIYMFGEHRDVEQFEASLEKLIEIKDEYDRIYASHDECEIPKDYAERVREAWIQVRNGCVPYEMIDLFGNKVRSYTTDICGFFME
ncbi:MAG: MBL fold metallo-hydrolase [Lachnospiraceae bacterium]|nr:MBL fold metallo-hydrolase [Lachnospiraceae bacterium]